MTAIAPGPAGVSATTTTFVDFSDAISPPPLSGPVFHSYRASMAIQYDSLSDAAALAVRARFPSVAPPDAFPYLGQDRTIYQGFAEPQASYILRLQQWLDLLPYEGFPSGIMCALLGYVIPATWTVANPGQSVLCRTVDFWSNWNTYEVGANPVPLAPVNQKFPIVQNITAVTNDAGLFEITVSSPIQFPTGTTVSVLGVVGTGGMDGVINTEWQATVLGPTTFTLQGSVFVGAYTSGGTVGSPIVGYPPGFPMLKAPVYQTPTGNWRWDQDSQPFFYNADPEKWWLLWPILYSVSDAPFTTPIATWAPATGTVTVGTTTPSYSDPTEVGYPASAAYVGSGGSGTSASEFDWDDGTCWDWAGDGPGIGYAAAAGQGTAITAIARQFKAANVWIPYVIVSYDATMFDPAQAFGSSKLPDGTWGTCAKVVTDATWGTIYEASRPPGSTCSLISGSGQNGGTYGTVYN
jgi:hypothetical protein